MTAFSTICATSATGRRIQHDPAHIVYRPKTDRPLPQFVREEQMDRLLDHTQQPDTYQAQLEHTIVLTFYETGMRLSELTSLDDNSVDYARSEIRVHGKGNKQRAIPFGDELAQALRSFTARRDAETPPRCTRALFRSARGTRLSPQQVRQMVKQQLSTVTGLQKRSPHVPSPPQCSTTEPTSKTCRSCSDTSASPQPKYTPTPRSSN